jgi:hypothetical protein
MATGSFKSQELLANEAVVREFACYTVLIRSAVTSCQEIVLLLVDSVFYDCQKSLSVDARFRDCQSHSQWTLGFVTAQSHFQWTLGFVTAKSHSQWTLGFVTARSHSQWTLGFVTAKIPYDMAFSEKLLT